MEGVEWTAEQQRSAVAAAVEEHALATHPRNGLDSSQSARRAAAAAAAERREAAWEALLSRFSLSMHTSLGLFRPL